MKTGQRRRLAGLCVDCETPTGAAYRCPLHQERHRVASERWGRARGRLPRAEFRELAERRSEATARARAGAGQSRMGLRARQIARELRAAGELAEPPRERIAPAWGDAAPRIPNPPEFAMTREEIMRARGY
jgi:hypothetical protein